MSDLKEFLHAHPGYLKWGSKKLSKKLDIQRDEAYELQRIVRNEIRGSVESTSTSKHEKPLDEDHNVDWMDYKQYLAYRGIDPEDVVSAKHWQGPGGQNRYSIVTKEDKEIEANYEAILIKSLQEHVPAKVLAIRTRFGPADHVGILNLFDAHIDKISIPEEVYGSTGGSIDDNFAALQDKFDEAIESFSHYKPDTIYFPVGSDFWNTNGPGQFATKRGTPQRTLVPHEEAFERGVEFYRNCIDKLSQVCNNVAVITLKGNHDEDPVFYLGVLLSVAYENHVGVTVHNTRHQRKYFQEGQWGFAFGHGDKEKKKLERLPLFFAQEAPQVWAATKMREMFFGDLHHTNEYKFQRAKDGIGVYVYFLRSSSEADLWHSDEGWIGIPKSIYAFVYDKNSGRKKNITISW